MASELAKGTVVGRYRLQSLIASGESCDVYHGVAIDGDREVAIRVLRAELSGDPVRVDRFDREGRIARSLSHPNVVTVYESGRVDGRPFCVTQLLEPQSLAQLVESGGPLPVDRALAIAEHVLQAIFLAHRKRLAHGALTAQSIRFDRRGTTIVTGLDVEARDGETLDPATDLRGVGRLLHEMVTGRVDGVEFPAGIDPDVARAPGSTA